MLQIKNLTFIHRQDLRILLADFRLLLNPGDRAVIVGEEGNGKSTLLKWIYDPALVEPYVEAEGERAWDGRMAYLPQELPESERELSVYAFFGERESFWNAEHRELQLLARELGLPGEIYYSEQTMGSLSGGERVKLSMARLLLERPDILLLDEPSNDIDIETLEWMERQILSFPGIVLFISHDETLIERTANKVVLLEQLHRKSVSRWTAANMPYAQFVEQRRRGMEKQEQMAYSERREERAAMERFRRIQQRVEHEQRTITRRDPSGGRLLKKKMASVKAMERRYEREHAEMTEIPVSEDAINIKLNYQRALPAGRTVLALDMPELRAPDGRLLARELRLTVRGPEKLCIIGRNGAGKSTLLRQIRSELETRENLHVCYMPQDYGELLDPTQTPVEFLVPSGDKAAVTEARSFLGAMHYTTREMERPLGELSGGQRAKVLLLKLGLTETDVLLLDEPTRNFSPLSGPEIREMLRAFPGAILAVSHDRKFISEVCDRVLRLTENGLEDCG
jgi:ATPase subunit of ABC transporter with duplicated ATPase domains